MNHRTLFLVLCSIAVVGCGGESSQVVQLATQEAERQARQNEKLLELETTVSRGAQELVAADAASRKELTSLHRAIQSEFQEIGRQRDALEGERRAIAAERRTEPLYTAAVNLLTSFLVAIGPLALCGLLLRRSADSVEATEIADVVLRDILPEDPRPRLSRLDSSASSNRLLSDPSERENSS